MVVNKELLELDDEELSELDELDEELELLGRRYSTCVLPVTSFCADIYKKYYILEEFNTSHIKTLNL